jgi:hypothetical protein
MSSTCDHFSLVRHTVSLFPPKSALGNSVATRSDPTRFGDYKDERKPELECRDLTWLWEM